MVTGFLDLQFRLFLQHVLQPYLKFTDHWIRYKWQHRGSGHLHCLFWVPSAPPMDQSTDELRAVFAQYWGQQITAWNLDPSRVPDARNPASLPPINVVNTTDQFTAFLNRLQLHTTCRPSYCLRVQKGSTIPTCRFFFPRPLCQEPIVTKDINHVD
jgi:ATP-dependent DNA helicase PIF1